MQVSLSENEGCVVAELNGTLDESAADAFDELHAVIERPGSRLVLDCSGSERATSAGLGVRIR